MNKEKMGLVEAMKGHHFSPQTNSILMPKAIRCMDKWFSALANFTGLFFENDGTF